MFNRHAALSANASTQRHAPFPLPAAAIPAHTGINFQEKRDKWGRKETVVRHKAQL